MGIASGSGIPRAPCGRRETEGRGLRIIAEGRVLQRSGLTLRQRIERLSVFVSDEQTFVRRQSQTRRDKRQSMAQASEPALAAPKDTAESNLPPEAESTRKRILDVAEALFASKGLAGTAVRDIAREVGLTAPSLYNHFVGKQALYEAVIARGVQPLFDLIQDSQGAPGQTELERTGDILDGIMDHLAEHPNLAKLIQHESLLGGASLSQIVDGWLRPIVAGGQAAMASNPGSVWTEDERPLAVAAWIHVILGHFAAAPLLRELFDFDPLAPEQIERQKRFLRHYAQLMISGSDL